jgi:ribosomal protein S18 acetylase RimI-like enzyme
VAEPASPGSPGPAAADFGFELRIAWRRDDPEIAADAIDFWKRNALLPPGVDPAERAKELTGAAYKDGRLVALATATLARIDRLHARFALLRASTDPAFRRSHAQRALGVPIREAVRSWSLAHPEERVAGRIAFMERDQWGDLDRQPVWPTTRLSLAGYDDRGRQVRVDWFDHFRFDQEAAPQPLPSAPPAAAPDVELRPAWRRDDPQVLADAIAFWKRLGILPGNVTPEARAKELVLAAYRHGRVVGLVTAELGVLPQVRARMAMLRGAVDPELRRSHVGSAMLLAASKILETWSAEHPDERLAGIGGIIESPELAAVQSQPYWPNSRFGLIGFTPDGRQIRVAWFEDFRLDQP